jgi:hypothetical protein
MMRRIEDKFVNVLFIGAKALIIGAVIIRIFNEVRKANG